MLTRTFTLRFITPAFLGNAEQTGQWRTPPIKALLRQWWRVAYAAQQPGAVDIAAMRTAEGQLFGVAADGEGESRKSLVRLRLGSWKEGGLSPWSASGAGGVMHPEVKGQDGRCKPVDSQLYLGYGPLVSKGNGTALKHRAAIQAGEESELRLAVASEAEVMRIDKALWLMQHYGTLGGRSRNGWGSFSLTPSGTDTAAFDTRLDDKLTSFWQDALALDWPHAIGRDEEGPLIWQTGALPDWKAVMRRLAEIKIALRTQQAFKFTSDANARSPEPRHWLSYPVTNHSVAPWKDGKRDLRLPNSLRFKVRTDARGQLRGVIFHVPCKPPAAFQPDMQDMQTIKKVWQHVHSLLDHADQKLERIAA